MKNFDYDFFSNELANSESSNNYLAINSEYNAFGKYQFSENTFNDMLEKLGMVPVSINEFLNNKSLQETAFREYVKEILDFISNNNLGKFLEYFITGKTNKIYTQINQYGLVAGAWLAGRQGLKSYLDDNKDAHDSNGTYVSDYISKFSENFNKKKSQLYDTFCTYFNNRN